MLSCEELSVTVGEQNTQILKGARAVFQKQGLNAIIGPSGCGKTTLVKAILGIIAAEGHVFCDGKQIESADDLLGQVGFAPQFSIAYPKLTVEESIAFTLELNVADADERAMRLDTILGIVGLNEHRAKSVEALSGGQLRRLGLGLELTLDPPCLVCDEVTSGLDPRSEDHILDLLRTLSDEKGKTFLCIIHNLAKLDRFDRITVVFDGDVVFQGDLAHLLRHFEIADAFHLYDRLNEHSLDHWQTLWAEAQASIVDQEKAAPEYALESRPVAERPSGLAQLMTLLRRRALLFFRDRGYLLLTAAITFGFPCLVVIFALGGLPQIESIALERTGGFLEEMQANVRFQMESFRTASLVTSLIMFQVILLTLMGSNNGSREIASERLIYEKERLSGLRVGAYVSSKVIFTALVAIFQGLWMTFFVKMICQFPGPWSGQLLMLSSVCVSMSVVCLGFSALFQSSEKASLLSVYLVGFQLPLSGVVLALPDYLVWVCRPFINSYWGWAGYLSTMKDTRLFDAFRQHESGWLSDPWVGFMVLVLQAMIGVFMIVVGCHRKQWQ